MNAAGSGSRVGHQRGHWPLTFRCVYESFTLITQMRDRVADRLRQATCVGHCRARCGDVRHRSAPGQFSGGDVHRSGVVAVGAIPKGLPAAVTIVLAIGVVRMSRSFGQCRGTWWR